MNKSAGLLIDKILVFIIGFRAYNAQVCGGGRTKTSQSASNHHPYSGNRVHGSHWLSEHRDHPAEE